MIKIYEEKSIDNIEFWGGAVSTINHVAEANKLDLLEQIIEDMYPDGVNIEALNDYLWFESDNIYNMLDIENPDDI